MDATGCPMPDTCTPIAGDCPVTCPVTCPLDHIQCPGGVMPDGCPMPDTCMPVTAECPAAACPAVCNFAIDKTCPGGVDASGCMLPDTCMSQTGMNYNINKLGSILGPVIQANGRLTFEDNLRSSVNQCPYWDHQQYGHSGGNRGWLGVERCQLCLQDTSWSTK